MTGDSSVPLAENEFVIDPKTERDEAMFSTVIENVKNTVAGLNAIFTERAHDGEVMSSRTEFNAFPGTQILTPRQYGVVKVNVWDIWQTGLVQSLAQGRPIVYEEPAFGTDPNRIDLRCSGDQTPHVSVMYFGDEFDITPGADRAEIRFRHDADWICPVGEIDEDELISPIFGVELKHYSTEDTLTATIHHGGDAGEMEAQLSWADDGVDQDDGKQRTEAAARLQQYDSLDDNGAIEAIEETVEILAEIEEMDGTAASFPDIVNMIAVKDGVWKTAELTRDTCDIRRELARLFGLSIHDAETKQIRAVICADESERERAKALDQAITTQMKEERIERLVGWMLSYPEPSINYASETELPSEKALIDAVNQMARGGINSEEMKHLLLLQYPFNASSETGLRAEIQRGKGVVEAVNDFDDRYGASMRESVLLPTWAHRGGVFDQERLASGQVTKSEFWRI